MNRQIRVLSFNIWRGGGRSLEATIEAIDRAGADLVGLQECSPEAADAIATTLGFGWVHDRHAHAILSPHPLVGIGTTKNEWGGLGATADIRGTRVHLFDAHLHWIDYGPYLLREGHSVGTVLATEKATRMPGLEELLDRMRPALASDDPVFLVGDFNAPSHLDYAAMPWPTSLAVEACGLRDAWRAVHPEARVCPGLAAPFAYDEPGITWSPIVEEEVRGAFDRIDFLHYTPREGRVAPTAVVTLDGRTSVSPWPSDHRAVLGSFVI